MEESISEHLANEGVNIFFTSRSTKTIVNMEKTLKKYKVKSKGIKVDFLNKKSFKNFLDKIKKMNIDILVNNAGHTLDLTDPYCSIKDWHNIMNVNFETPVQIVNALVPKMKKKNWGRIVNITSCAGLENSGPYIYCSKAALTAYTRTMGRILASECKNIVMTAVFPGVYQGGHEI